MTKFNSILVLTIGLLILSNCGGGPRIKTSTHHIKKVKTAPYVIKGVKYTPQKYYEYVAQGLASHYGQGDVFHGRLTATGEVFDKNGMTAAHRTLPLPCLVRVTNLSNGRSVRLKVNDRGPFVDTHKRVIDVSAEAARRLDFYSKGLARVRIDVLVPESIALAKGGKWVQKAVIPSTTLPTRKQTVNMFTTARKVQKGNAVISQVSLNVPTPRKSPAATAQKKTPAQHIRQQYGTNVGKIPLQ